jgi:hypothetical protein
VTGVADWVTLRHEETGGETRVPDHPDVLAAHEARGWSVVVDEGEPERTVYVLPDGERPEWVDLTHPDLPTAAHRIPNHPDAIAGMQAAGWVLPPPPADAVEEALREVHPRGGRATKAERAAAEERAAVQAATTDDPPQFSGPDDTAGDGANEEGVTRG